MTEELENIIVGDDPLASEATGARLTELVRYIQRQRDLINVTDHRPSRAGERYAECVAGSGGLPPNVPPERQLLALHRQWHSLIRELKDAELALGEDDSETNYARLQDVKARLSSIDGTEALIEGFGASSGRPSRSL